MNRLLEIGFEVAGHWRLAEGKPEIELIRHGEQHNILYAFVSDGAVKYIGKTVRPLAKRMYGYQRPGPTQTTNIRNNALIKALLEDGEAVDVLALPDNGLMHYGQFHLNLAAGLEDSLIAVIDPEWNGQRTKQDEGDSVDMSEPPMARASFTIAVQKTYFNTGYFNVPVEHGDAFGADGQPIEIYCGGADRPLTGTINRASARTGAPRIMGGAGLRDWFQANVGVMNDVTVRVTTPNTIHLART